MTAPSPMPQSPGATGALLVPCSICGVDLAASASRCWNCGGRPHDRAETVSILTATYGVRHRWLIPSTPTPSGIALPRFLRGAG